eukprot:CAMPEP_0203676458 /NCGR_PEP_ID=MMETSP0090-20130426/24598_1 /ASSEMBLY_ACC=CAM_ASM_001088 /TAXON_ID=426623 /ORGANISM="Chaetoceros affinis, Strain CCMP159" /LENGTH=708 /DNA_ID=CAMNT_0050543009 /DNA_START=74 /DNA_END=2197 /DNA_ORIENTATION=-
MSGYGGNYDFNNNFNSLYSNASEQSTVNNTNSFNAFLNSIQDSSAAGNGGSGGIDAYGQQQQQQHHQLQDPQQQQQQPQQHHHHDHHLQQQQQQQQQPLQQQHLNYHYSSKPQQQQHHHHHHPQQPSYSTGGTNGVNQNMFSYQDTSSLSSLMNNMNNKTSGSGGDCSGSMTASTLGSHGVASAGGNKYMASSSSSVGGGVPRPSSSSPGYMLHQPGTYDSNTMDYFALLQQHQQGQQRQPPRQPTKQPQHYEFQHELNDYEKWDATPLPTTNVQQQHHQQQTSSNSHHGQNGSLSNIDNHGSFGSSSEIADFAQNFFDQNCNFDELLEPISQKKTCVDVSTNVMGNSLSLSSLADPTDADIINTISSMSQYDPTLNQGLKNPINNNNHKKPPPQNDIFSGFTMNIISLSQEPLSAHEIIEKTSFRCNEVLTRFLPCVEFLVACQQELRAGLAMVVQKNGRGRSIFSAQEFYKTYFEPLTVRFWNRNKNIMPHKELQDSYDGIKSLLRDVKKAEQKGNFEGMKNSFLGGMRDGESWGLRKWLSKNGGALKICNDIELIWGGLRDLNREEATTKELARILRPKAKHALKRLQDGVPKAYQEISTAHPYLPFFHRLECALKGLSEFDPEDDDVICIDDSDSDDDEIQEIKVVKKPAKKSNTQGAAGSQSIGSTLRTANKFELASSIDEVASAIEAGNELRPPTINFDEYW